MKITILGAGITGVTSAYVLASRGHEVEVIDREKGAALQTSFSNGAQLSYSHAEPWANPKALIQAIKWMFVEDAPLVIRPRADWRMIKWGLQFIGNCNQERARINCERMMRIGLYSKQKMAQIRAETQVEFDFDTKGILHVFSNEASFDGAIAQAEFQETLGCKELVYTPTECLAQEPALKNATRTIIGGLYSPIDETGDIHMFTQNLAAYCAEKLGVQFSYNTDVIKLNKDGYKLASVTTSKGENKADAYVMCLGPHTPLLCDKIGVKVPIYPMKGYSITLPAWEGAPNMSVTDAEKKVVYSRIGNRIRAAGTAEFAGYNTEVREPRIQQIMGSIRDLYPAVDEGDTISNMQRWACIRPQTPDGPPLVSKTPCHNLYLNTGHGTLGWTQGAGTAYLLADIMEGNTPEIKSAGLDLARYRE
jgi:D-amino-acid dehydrogenase